MKHYPQYNIHWTRNQNGEVIAEPISIEPRQFRIDLKWSLWTKYWEQIANHHRGKIAVAALIDALNGLGEVTVFTAPKKEIRYGKVTVDGHKAWIDFSFEWDEPYEQLWRIEELVDDDLSDEETALCRDSIEEHFCEMKWGIDREIEADTLEQLLEKIDDAETELLKLEDQQSKMFEEDLKGMAEWIKERRAELPLTTND